MAVRCNGQDRGNRLVEHACDAGRRTLVSDPYEPGPDIPDTPPAPDIPEPPNPDVPVEPPAPDLPEPGMPEPGMPEPEEPTPDPLPAGLTR